MTEGFPCFFLSCTANARVKLAKTGHGQHSSTLACICVVRLLFVLFCVLFVCKCVLSPCDNPTAVNKYIIYHKSSWEYQTVSFWDYSTWNQRRRSYCQAVLANQHHPPPLHILNYVPRYGVTTDWRQCHDAGVECGETLKGCGAALTLRWLMSYIYGAPILDVSRSHTTTQHSR